jgi:predicted GIY-YIG superfamily endonuclease
LDNLVVEIAEWRVNAPISITRLPDHQLPDELMLIRDRLMARLAEMGPAPDYSALAAEVLGIRNAPADLARRLVAQALVVEDRRDAWTRAGARIAAAAPDTPGVYVLRDEHGAALYVGKANHLRRRLRAHFAGRRWKGLKAPFARVLDATWQEVGSEIEALLREAALIDELQPVANVQVGAPSFDTRAIPATLVRDVVVVVPSVDPASAELVCARADGGWLITRIRRDGRGLQTHAALVMRFFRSPLRGRFDAAPLAPIVFSWLAGRGASASRVDPHDGATVAALRERLRALVADPALFAERIVVLHSEVRSSHRVRP